MKKITFKYKDWLSKGKWRTQQCTVESVEKCIKIYGLEDDPTIEYEIIKVEEVNE